jgi:hypothetical protein
MLRSRSAPSHKGGRNAEQDVETSGMAHHNTAPLIQMPRFKGGLMISAGARAPAPSEICVSLYTEFVLVDFTIWEGERIDQQNT